MASQRIVRIALQPLPATLNVAPRGQRERLPSCLDLEPGSDLADVMKKSQCTKALDVRI